jgi:HD superfamily phosphohydrolase
MKDIYGYINFDKIAKDCVRSIVETDEFQYLDDKKQLGCCCLVYAEGQHTRLNHSLGVAYLAQTLILSLRNKQPELEITDSEVKCVVLAGLLHDIGHGPLSHFYDEWLSHRKVEKPYCEHEYRSGVVIEHIVEKYGLDITPKEIVMIISMINPVKIPKPRRFLYQIIANNDSNLDVDKIDYLYRDAKALNNGYHKFISVFSVIENMRVCKNQLVVHESNEMDILNIFTLRYMLHKETYNSVETNAVNSLMLRIFDILQDKTDLNLISTNKKEILDLLPMTDLLIEKHILDHPESGQLYAKILSRSWWKSIGTFSISKPLDYNKLVARFAEIEERFPSIEIRTRKIGLVSGNKPNPLRCIDFYNDDDKEKELHKLDKFVLFHERYQEILVFVYRKNELERRDDRIVQEVKRVINEETIIHKSSLLVSGMDSVVLIDS